MLSTAFAVTVLLSSVSATVHKRNQAPLPPCSYPFTSFVYSGCYQDNDVYNRPLPFTAPIDFNNATIEICAAACKGNNYRYAGLEYYGQCYCGASISALPAPSSDCNLTCNGAPGEICGGFNRMSVYQDPTFPNAADIAVSSDYSSLGCYTEGSNGRSLAYSQNDGQLNNTLMTTELCLDQCGSLGYPFAGTEYSDECYCGVVLGNGTVSAPATDCNMPCSGNSSETCGGPNRLNLYVAKTLESTDPCETPVSYSISSSAPTSTSSSVSSSAPSSTSSSASSSTPSSTSSSVSSSTPSTTTTTSTPCSIPSNTYTPPPITKTCTTSATPAPTSSCLCPTPTAWAGSNAVGGYHLPCVGCNDNSYQRQSYPFKLFNNKNFGQCPVYGKGNVPNACYDSCTTQYNWCMTYANSCKNSRNPPESWSSANGRCRQQYSDCWAAQQWVKDDGRCYSNTPSTSNAWYSWCSSWLSQWL
ncbi:WSC-domain-containing protein [Lepidopterella palustris CBS 459.81]|uniref:WSC-domain-containing protein n=1 Tax=Lepidopterella palustris CBS 459.81 TaxID=1314670 RepID=A0A8E2EFT7_9PEZI|nr:WSC-domain-containing protein [Lepidopterella palustris CBS 459.81]